MQIDSSLDPQTAAPSNDPFKLNTPWQQLPGVGHLLNAAATHALALPPLTRVYRALEHCENTLEFTGTALQVMGVGHRIENEGLQRIPAQGAAVVVANHPYGGLEGLLLMHLLLQRRSDVRLLANHLLWRIPELRPVLIPVDVLDPSRKSANLAGLRAALNHVKAGGLLALFPAGAVSHLQGTRIVDPQWNATAARLIRKCNAPVTPVHFAGHNSAGFQLAGLIHPLLRTALLPRELVNKRHHEIRVSIGNALPAAQLQTLEDDTALAGLLRLQTYALARTRTSANKSGSPRLPAMPRTPEPVAAAIAPALIAAELDALPPEQQLLETSGLRVVHAHARQLRGPCRNWDACAS